MQKKISKLGVYLLVLAFAAGCAVTPAPTGFLGDYTGMSGRFDLDQVRVSSEADLKAYENLVITPVDTARLSTPLDDEDMRNIISTLEITLRDSMMHYFQSVTEGTGGKAAPEKTARLEIAVTELQPTNVVKNLMVGFGAGNATASIEGRFVDAATGREIAAFADRKKGSPFTKKEYDAQKKFPNWSKLQYLYVFTDIWAENIGNLAASMKKIK